MRIEVTQSDIDHGERGSCTACPIAIALERHLGCHVTVQENDTEVAPPCAWIRIQRDGSQHQLPGSAESFIRRFDDGKSVAPFAFNLNIPFDTK